MIEPISRGVALLAAVGVWGYQEQGHPYEIAVCSHLLVVLELLVQVFL